MSRAIDEERYRAGALSTLVPHLPETLKEEVLSEALTAARAFDEEYARARALSGLVPHLPETLKEEVLAEALTAARAFENGAVRARALSGLIPLLVTLSSHTLFQLWRTTLRLAARRTRAKLLSDIRSLAPVIAALGGQEIMPEVFHSIQEVGTWQF